MLGTAGLARRVARNRLRRLAAVPGEALFDRRRGVATRGVSAVPGDTEAHVHLTHYEGARARALAREVRRLGVVPGDCTFVDLGCGKGKALLVAAELGFARVVGVELDPALAAVARENVRRHAPRRRAAATPEVLERDAREVEWPAGPFVLFLYNPFGEPILRDVLERLGAALLERPRKVHVVYMNPRHTAAADAQPFLRRRPSGARCAVWETF